MADDQATPEQLQTAPEQPKAETTAAAAAADPEEADPAGEDAYGRPQGEGSGGKQDGTGLVVPLARIKKMMKEIQDVKSVSADASWAVARATELFLQELAGRAHAAMAADGSRKALEYKDVAAVVKSWTALDFLSDVVPEKVKVGDVREQLQKQMEEFTPRVLNDD